MKLRAGGGLSPPRRRGVLPPQRIEGDVSGQPSQMVGVRQRMKLRFINACLTHVAALKDLPTTEAPRNIGGQLLNN